MEVDPEAGALDLVSSRKICATHDTLRHRGAVVKIQRISGIFRMVACLSVCFLAGGELLGAEKENCLEKLGKAPPKFQNAAVLIGVTNPHDHGDVKPLSGAAADVNLLKQFFEAADGFKNNVYVLLDSDAKTAHVRECLQGVGRLAGAGSTVVVYVSLRGVASRQASRGILLTEDSALDKWAKDDSGAPPGNGLTTAELSEIVGKMGAQQRYLFLDLCRSPAEKPKFDNYINSRVLERSFTKEAKTMWVVTASTGIAPSNASLFARELNRVLRKKGLDFGPLFEDLREGIQRLSGNMKQIPAQSLEADTAERARKAGRASVRTDCLMCPRPERGALIASAVPMWAPEPADEPAEWVKKRLDAAKAEAEGQRIFVRYGVGDHFPGDPLQQCKTGTRVAGDFKLCKEEFAAATSHFEEAARLYREAAAEGDGRLLVSLDERVRFSRAQALLLSDVESKKAGMDAEAALGPPSGSWFAETHNLLGIAYFEQERLGDAEKQFREAIRLAPYWGYPRHNLALTLVEHGAYGEAENTYREAIAMTPLGEQFKDDENACFAGKRRLIVARPYLYYNLGVLLQRVNRLGEAQTAYCLAAASFRMRLARLGTNGGLDEKWREAARINLADVQNSEGVLFQMRGKRKQAEAQFKRALEGNPGLLAAKFNLGRLKEKKERETAKQLYREVVKACDEPAHSGDISCRAAKNALAEL